MKNILIKRDSGGFTNVVFWSEDCDKVTEEANKIDSANEVYLLKVGEAGDSFVGLYRRVLKLKTSWGLTSTNYGNSAIS